MIATEPTREADEAAMAWLFERADLAREAHRDALNEIAARAGDHRLTTDSEPTGRPHD